LRLDAAALDGHDVAARALPPARLGELRAGLDAVGLGPGGLASDERRPSRGQRGPFLLPGPPPAALGRPRRGVRSPAVRRASPSGGVGGVDHGAPRPSLGLLLSPDAARLASLDRVRTTALVRRRAGGLPALPSVEGFGRDAAGGASSSGLLSAAPAD